MSVLASTDVETILEAALATKPALVVVDSIQTVALDELDGPPGSVGQVRASAARLGGFAHDHGITVLLVGQVTKDGSLAGPRALEHLVDAVLMLEGDRYGTLRILRALKNRHGATDEVGVLEMTTAGLREVTDPSAAFLGRGRGAAPGAVVAALQEGSRPLLVEVQALVAPAGLGPPRRTVSGLDRDRLALLIAVLARRGGIDVGGRDVYASLTVACRSASLPLTCRWRWRSHRPCGIGRSRLRRSRAARSRCSVRSGRCPAWDVGCERLPAWASREPSCLPTRQGTRDRAGVGLALVEVSTIREALASAFGADGGTTG